MTDNATRTRKRLRLLLLIGVFAAPMIAAYALYYGGWRPASARANGELVTPARPIADVELKRLDGDALRFSSFQRRWLLLYFGSSECTSACERALYNMRQVIAAQGRETHRVRAAMVITDRRALDMLRYQLKEYPDLMPLEGEAASVAQLARQFELPSANPLAGLHRIYVVDPLGNFMMSYPAEADPAGMRKDLTRLLRYSQVG
ncbi:MAG TPA: SCO family protein [Burkholderiaceae bacterium]|nr:SCO family protein [Burkholderiaceae bacterium]